MTTPAPHVRIWRQPDGLWRWCYVEPSGDGQPDLTLPSHRAYETRDEARSSALAAYPGIDLQEPHQPETETETEPHQPETKTRPRGKARLVLVALALGYAAWRRWRAWWSRLWFWSRW